jgi:hypothetical protein
VVFKKTARLEHHHIVIPRYLSDFIVKKAEKRNTNVSHEIMVCILFAMFNEKEGTM